jgi:hypothetical protein
MQRLFMVLLPLLIVGTLAACSNNQFPDVTDNVRKSLDGAGFKQVSVSQDREKGVVTLTGTVPKATKPKRNLSPRTMLDLRL